jgi:cysteinyl-tRNA synthetase
VAAIDDDLDLPTAVAVVREIRSGRTCPPTSGAGSSSMPTSSSDSDLDRSVGDATPTARRYPRRQELVAERADARAAREFDRADRIRTELAALGWEVVDADDGRRSGDSADGRGSRRP